MLSGFAGMAELADALDSGSSEVTLMQVQVLFPAPTTNNPNHSQQVVSVGEGLGFVLYLSIRTSTLKKAPAEKLQRLF